MRAAAEERSGSATRCQPALPAEPRGRRAPRRGSEALRRDPAAGRCPPRHPKQQGPGWALGWESPARSTLNRSLVMLVVPRSMGDADRCRVARGICGEAGSGSPARSGWATWTCCSRGTAGLVDPTRPGAACELGESPSLSEGRPRLPRPRGARRASGPRRLGQAAFSARHLGPRIL